MSYSRKRLKMAMCNEKQRPFLSTERKTLCHVLNGFKVERWEQKFGVAIDGCTRLDRFMCPQTARITGEPVKECSLVCRCEKWAKFPTALCLFCLLLPSGRSGLLAYLFRVLRPCGMGGPRCAKRTQVVRGMNSQVIYIQKCNYNVCVCTRMYIHIYVCKGGEGADNKKRPNPIPLAI